MYNIEFYEAITTRPQLQRFRIEGGIKNNIQRIAEKMKEDIVNVEG